MADTPLLKRLENTQSPQEGTSGAPGAGQSPTPMGEAGGLAITPELVAQVAARVYQLWLADMRIENERQRK